MVEVFKACNTSFVFPVILSELWRTCNSLTHETTMLKEDKVTKEKHLSSIIGKAFMDGWESIMEAIKILEGKGVEIRNKYHGMLIDLIECTPALNTCVEVVAGKQLFFHVVDNDKTANQILKVINQRKLPGDIHFMSLGNMDPKEHDYPNEEKCKVCVFAVYQACNIPFITGFPSLDEQNRS